MSPDTLGSLLTFSDQHRHVQSIVLSPQSPSSRTRLAALSDSLGRVSIMDVEEGEIIRVFKGYRDAQCAWLIPTNVEVTKQSETRKFGFNVLFLLIYLPRGILDIFPMRHGERVATLNVSSGGKLVQGCPSLGGNSSSFILQNEESWATKCFLMNPDGIIACLSINSNAVLRFDYFLFHLKTPFFILGYYCRLLILLF